MSYSKTAADETLILSPVELAELTGGEWSRPDALPRILRVALNPQTARPGDLLVTTNEEQWGRVASPTENQASLELLARRGGVAAVVRRGTSFAKDSLNLLLVDDTNKALLAIAQAARDKSKARRVLVTGTEGKTSFKLQLRHLLSDQVSVNARPDSNNMDRAISTALANTRSHHDVSIIEVGVPRKSKGKARAMLVRPDLAVITEIGYEHLTRHGSFEKLIEAKASVVSGLVPGGGCLIKSDVRYFDELRAAILSFRDLPIFTFGEREEDLGRLIDAQFDVARSGWEVRAAIDGRAVEYFLPLVEGHAPLSSVGVLAAVHLLGLDVERAAQRFMSYVPYETSGRLYELPAQSGFFRVYDQSHRNYLLGIEDFFRVSALLSPSPGARKVLVLGHVYDEREYGERVWEILPPARLRTLIEACGLDLLCTVGAREEFARVLEGTKIAWRHFSLPGELVEPLYGEMGDGDLLLVKGDLNEKMFLLTDGLRKMAKASRSKAESSLTESREGFLAALRPLELTDLPRFREALAAGEQTAWGYYFPFMMGLGRSSKRSVVWQEQDGSVCVFVQSGKGKDARLDLFAPPFPVNARVLQWCLDRVNDYNGDRSARIYWIDEKDMSMVKGLGTCVVKVKEQEYLYRPEDFLDLAGGRYRTIRRNIEQVRGVADLEVRPYAKDDAAGCLALLERWESSQGEKYESLLDRRYTRNCLELEPMMDDRDLRGEVVLVGGEIRAFSFGGEIRPGLGCFFVSKSDTAIPEMSYFARHHFLVGMTSCALVNDSSDMGSDGLRQLKESLRPSGMHTVYRAKQR